jgi:hypothetical protein
VVLEETATHVTVQTGPGEVRLPRARVDRIVRSTSDLSEFQARADALLLGTAADWLDLALWATEHDLATQAAMAYRRVLAVDPENVEAREALGQQKVADRWLSSDEVHRARGQVRFEGEWLSPADRDAILASRSSGDRRDADRRNAATRAQEAAQRARAAKEAEEWARWEARQSENLRRWSEDCDDDCVAALGIVAKGRKP